MTGDGKCFETCFLTLIQTTLISFETEKKPRLNNSTHLMHIYKPTTLISAMKILSNG